MFQKTAEKFQSVFSALAKNKKITEENISDAIRKVRMALLEADVNYSIASKFIKRVKEKALGEQVLKTISAADQFIKIVHEELITLMGKEEKPLQFQNIPSVLMLCGLQGSGKTTHCAKLAYFLQKPAYKKRVLLVACDLQRPAAIEQLQILGEKVGSEVFTIPGEKNPVKVAKKALEKAKKELFDVVIVDTAGRLHIDKDLMDQLQKIKEVTNPDEILFVANAATGQDAVRTATEFNEKITLTGTILSMLDGNTRAGAAISICEATGKPLRFEGIGEKISDLQPFSPNSMADRILGMGDVINLVRKAEEHIDTEEREKLEKKILKASFTYDDYLKQMNMMKKMGSFKSLMKMIPGMSHLSEFEVPEKELAGIEAMILSMTPSERLGFEELIPSRRRRIALGSGKNIDDVNRMIKGFKRIKQMFKKNPSFKKKLGKGKDLSALLGEGVDHEQLLKKLK